MKELRRCEIKDCKRYGHKHHIMGRGAHGEAAECEENYIYLCPSHHTFIPNGVHYLGRDTFASKHDLVESLTKRKGQYGRGRNK